MAGKQLQRVTKGVSRVVKIDAQMIDRVLEEISRDSKKVLRFLWWICDPNGVVRKEGRSGRRAKCVDI